MYHSFIIHLPVEGCLVCFDLLAIVNKEDNDWGWTSISEVGDLVLWELRRSPHGERETSPAIYLTEN